MSVKLVNWNGLREKGIDYSKSQINRKVNAGTFPAPVEGFSKEHVWLEEEVDRYIAERIASRPPRRPLPAAGMSRRA